MARSLSRRTPAILLEIDEAANVCARARSTLIHPIEHWRLTRLIKQNGVMIYEHFTSAVRKLGPAVATHWGAGHRPAPGPARAESKRTGGGMGIKHRRRDWNKGSQATWRWRRRPPPERRAGFKTLLQAGLKSESRICGRPGGGDDALLGDALHGARGVVGQHHRLQERERVRALCVCVC